MILVPEHFDKLKSIAKIDETWAGSSPRDWFDWIIKNVNENYTNNLRLDLNLSESKIKRSEIFSMVADERNCITSCCFTILAWGGMNRNYGALLFSAPLDWIEVAKKIRNGELSREDAYTAFFDLRAQGKLPGMRPAYFTKLIFFLMPLNRSIKSGYIMDQWTSASVNILCGTAVVKVRRGLVDDGNTASVYEKFCSVIDFIADDLSISSATIELMMFSQGRGRGEWRNYVILHRAIST